MGQVAPFCWNSRRWLILAGWNIRSCPDVEKMRLACEFCPYYKDKEQTRYYKQKMKSLVAKER